MYVWRKLQKPYPIESFHVHIILSNKNEHHLVILLEGISNVYVYVYPISRDLAMLTCCQEIALRSNGLL